MAVKFRVFRSGGSWWFYCPACDTHEHVGAWENAWRVIPVHLRWWHSGRPLLVYWQENLQGSYP